MKASFGILLFAVCGSLSVARADVIFSGSVSTTDQGGTPCSNAGAGAGSLSLGCSSTAPGTSVSAVVQGSGDAYSGSVLALSSVSAPAFTEPGVAVGSIQFELNDTYVLTGGTGTTTANFTVGSLDLSTTAMTCEFVFDGEAPVGCDARQTIAETVEYGVPFTIGLDGSIYAEGLNGASADGELSYDFTQPGLAATPEPSSILLLMPGVAGVVFAARRRASGRVGTFRSRIFG